jgi:hypothetical protein
MAIAKAPKYTGAVSVIPVYVKVRSCELMVPHAGFYLVIVKKHAVSCVGSNPRMSHKWMCFMWMATKIMFLFII